MTKNDIKKIAAIMMTADGGCGHCASDLLQQLDKTFPSFTEIIREVFESEYGSLY